eukprot:TRINITY_DN16348_c0_g1_i2.p1 TRINITY_DN16348_c0_g1~~TRINITY_DN16348_c0_g1_i2.p1  ORF type:complete len:148 (+),score=9.38 TRINITY_DN16348_c0_g1_i2:83-526(+)
MPPLGSCPNASLAGQQVGCTFREQTRSAFHVLDPRTARKRVTGHWRCWLPFFSTHQEWGEVLLGPGRRIDSACCRQQSRMTSCFTEPYNHAVCCSSSVYPQRCTARPSLNSPCASLDEIGQWFAVSPAALPEECMSLLRSRARLKVL